MSTQEVQKEFIENNGSSRMNYFVGKNFMRLRFIELLLGPMPQVEHSEIRQIDHKINGQRVLTFIKIKKHIFR